ncbi:MAG: hypothetical protein K2N12_03840 [Helicobacter sp.]|nr:hypothetical protein [Helicobacter sp.]
MAIDRQRIPTICHSEAARLKNLKHQESTEMFRLCLNMTNGSADMYANDSKSLFLR